MSYEEKILYPFIQDINVVQKKIPTQFPPHWHNAAEFVWALKDNCRYKVQGTVYTLNQGDFLLIWPGEVHEIIFVPENGIFFIQFSEFLIANHHDLTSAMQFLIRMKVLSHEHMKNITDSLANMMINMKNTVEMKKYFGETHCKMLIYQMLLLIGEYAYEANNNRLTCSTFSDAAWNKVHEGCSYIESHLNGKISLEEVAAVVGFSVSHFSRLFHKYLNVSFPQYVAQARVRAAVELLESTDISVTECAHQAGFQSITTFNKKFMDIMNISPREYRKLYQNILLRNTRH